LRRLPRKPADAPSTECKQLMCWDVIFQQLSFTSPSQSIKRLGCNCRQLLAQKLSTVAK